MLHTATLLGPSSVPTGCSHMGQLVLCPGVGRVCVCVCGGGDSVWQAAMACLPAMSTGL